MSRDEWELFWFFVCVDAILIVAVIEMALR